MSIPVFYVSFGVWPCMSYTDFIFCVKEQFIYDLPSRLGKCIKSESYADAVRFYTGAMPIFKVSYLMRFSTFCIISNLVLRV